MTIESLARPEIRDLHAYQTAVQSDGVLRLHANESPDRSNRLNRYPEIRSAELQSRLADRFGVAGENLLVTRGSSEAIDLLIRTFCRAGQDNIVITPPTFAMYQVYADIQGAETIRCPLHAKQDFAFDADSVSESCTASSKLVFICSPNNPSGNLVPRSEIIRLIEARRDKSIIVVDEAYIEFSDTGSMADRIDDYENLVILRTLSKALALAGARCGAVIGSTAVTRMLNGVLAPYALATPVIDCVLHALSTDDGQSGQSRIQGIVAERERLYEQLAAHDLVQKVWPSQTNFLLVQFRDLVEIQNHLRRKRILIRDFSDQPGLENCARITVGNPDDNDRLLAAMK
jgi:histidinol-phosphate aminotransferase